AYRVSELPAVAYGIANNSCGVPRIKLSPAVRTSTAIIFRVEVTKNSSRLSPRQCGSRPSPSETFHSPVASFPGANGRTYTSYVPVLSEANANHRPSGDTVPIASLNSDLTSGIGFLSPFSCKANKSKPVPAVVACRNKMYGPYQSVGILGTLDSRSDSFCPVPSEAR